MASDVGVFEIFMDFVTFRSVKDGIKNGFLKPKRKKIRLFVGKSRRIEK